MKKLFFLLVCVAIATTAGVLTSCDTKKETKKLGSYELVETNGLFGLKDSTGRTILSPEFLEIKEMPQYKAVFAKKEGDLTTIVTKTYMVLDDVKLSSLEPTGNPDYVYIKGEANKNWLWRLESSYCVGPFEDIRLIEDIVFLKDDGKWGAATLDHTGLAPRTFERVIVVKNDKTRAVLVKDAKGWAMYDQNGVSDGVRYDSSSKELEKQVKTLNVAEDVVVTKVNWPL